MLGADAAQSQERIRRSHSSCSQPKTTACQAQEGQMHHSLVASSKPGPGSPGYTPSAHLASSMDDDSQQEELRHTLAPIGHPGWVRTCKTHKVHLGRCNCEDCHPSHYRRMDHMIWLARAMVLVSLSSHLSDVPYSLLPRVARCIFHEGYPAVFCRYVGRS